jgi:hypothetical protein
MKTWITAALALATVASAHAAPLDQLDWRTQEGFEQAYRIGVQYGFEHGTPFSADPKCNSENCFIDMQYSVAGEDYAFVLSLGSADVRGKVICVRRSDDHRTCANDYGHVWTSHYVEGDWKTVRFWQNGWPDEALFLDPANWKTRDGFEKDLRDGVQFGFDHGSWFRSECKKECNLLIMSFTRGDKRYVFETFLRTPTNAQTTTQLCVVSGDTVTCGSNFGRVWTNRWVDGAWKEDKTLQNGWPVKPAEPSLVWLLIYGGFASLLLGCLAIQAVPMLPFPTMRWAALFAKASLFVICRLPAGWKNRLARVTAGLSLMARWWELKDAEAARALIAAYVLAWRKRRALNLIGKDFEAFTAQRDAHWIHQLAQRGSAIPPERLMALIALAHPDKHNGSLVATETTQWLLSLRASRAA